MTEASKGGGGSVTMTGSGEDTPKFQIGDTIVVPCHNGSYTATVMKVYKNHAEAVAQCDRPFAGILQSPRGKADLNKPFYYCQVANPNLNPPRPLGVGEEHASLKKRCVQANKK